MVYNNIPRITSKSSTMGNTFMKRSPGECFMCKTNQEVRYFDLFVIGSEGCHLCLPCEIQVVEMVRQAANQATVKKKEEWIATLEEVRFLITKKVEFYINAAPCSKCFSRESGGGMPPLGLCLKCSKPPKNAFTGMVSG